MTTQRKGLFAHIQSNLFRSIALFIWFAVILQLLQVFLLGLLIVVVSMALAAEAAKFEAARSAEAASKREMKRGQGT